MKYRLKKNTSAEQAYIRDLECTGPLQRVERGESRILPASEYPEPLKRFLARQRSTLNVHLSASAKKKLERLSRATGIDVNELARRWVEQGIAREAS
jgi:hypothetical protein